jgi:antitoxin component YwqK of YwqJK toxin-antitoxin module
MQKTNSDYLCRTFKSVNKFMSDITQAQFKNILEASDTIEMYPNSTLPIKLVDYLVNHISHNAFKDEKNNGKLDTKGQFSFDLSMLGMLIEDPK